MHIVFATMQFGPGYYQGTERYITNLAKGLIQDGHQVSVIAGDPLKQWPKGIKQITTEDDIKVYATDVMGWTAIEGAPIDDYKKTLQYLAPDICHLVNPAHIGINFIRAAQALELASVITVTDYWWLCPKQTLTRVDGSLCNGFRSVSECWECTTSSHRNSLIRTLHQQPIIGSAATTLLKFKSNYSDNSMQWPKRKELINAAIQQAQAVICLSKTGQNAIEGYFSCSNTHYIPVGLANEWFTQEKAVTPVTPTVQLGFIGTISRHKGLLLLMQSIAAAINSNNITLHIAGTFDDKEYEKIIMVASKSIECKFYNRLDESEVRNLIDQMDAIVVPSQWPENQPQVILESFARKIPVISSTAPGAAELVPEPFIFSTQKELKALIENISAIKHNYPIPNVANFSNMTAATSDLYSQLCAS